MLRKVDEGSSWSWSWWCLGRKFDGSISGTLRLRTRCCSCRSVISGCLTKTAVPVDPSPRFVRALSLVSETLFPAPTPGWSTPTHHCGNTQKVSRAVCWSVVVCLFISIVKPTRCTNVSNYFIFQWHSTCFGRSFRPASEVQDCTYRNRRLLYVRSWTPYFILEWHPTCFGWSSRPSSAVQDCTYSNRHMSHRYCSLLASKQTAVSVWLLYVQSWTPDDGRKDRPKHVECHSKIK